MATTRLPTLRNAWPLLLAAAIAPARAQTGTGLKGDYYEGTNFEKYVLTRRDATINFNWGQQPPAPRLPAEDFSVRWTGWLMPPTSGKYVFHVTVDDGIRLWLNDRLLLNEWRGQPQSSYTAAVELRAGEPYRLRVDYCQYGLDTRVFVTWEQPAATAASWRNLWGMTSEKARPEPISAAYLFQNNPKPVARPAASAAAAPAPKALPAASVAPPPAPRRAPRTATVVPRPRRPAAPEPRPAPAPTVPPPPAAVAAADSSRPARLANLAVGEAIILPDLYFDQGQARLLPAVRTALDGLAAALRARPALRFEVQGHTDNVGNAELNRQLSQQRAEAVCLYLTAHGVAEGQLRPVGYGGTQPVADNADPAQRPRNRRVALRRL
ncbi:OmpA family protein [Hymenobacter sp. BT523]|nr:OmpA family protein [Hymenobacter sp. BT523]